MSKRDIVEEVLAKKQRARQSRCAASFKLFELNSSFLELEKRGINDKTLLSLYLVGIASCIEVAVRDAVRKPGRTHLNCPLRLKTR
jgi:hypothetical protein